MELKLWIGIAAGCLTAVSALPQVVKTMRTRDVKHIAPFMFIILLLGNSLWTVYGIMLDDVPIIVTNAFSALLDIVMLVLKVLYRNKN